MLAFISPSFEARPHSVGTPHVRDKIAISRLDYETSGWIRGTCHDRRGRGAVLDMRRQQLGRQRPNANEMICVVHDQLAPVIFELDVANLTIRDNAHVNGRVVTDTI